MGCVVLRSYVESVPASGRCFRAAVGPQHWRPGKTTNTRRTSGGHRCKTWQPSWCAAQRRWAGWGVDSCGGLAVALPPRGSPAVDQASLARRTLHRKPMGTHHEEHHRHQRLVMHESKPEAEGFCIALRRSGLQSASNYGGRCWSNGSAQWKHSRAIAEWCGGARGALAFVGASGSRTPKVRHRRRLGRCAHRCP